MRSFSIAFLAMVSSSFWAARCRTRSCSVRCCAAAASSCSRSCCTSAASAAPPPPLPGCAAISAGCSAPCPCDRTILLSGGRVAKPTVQGQAFADGSTVAHLVLCPQADGCSRRGGRPGSLRLAAGLFMGARLRVCNHICKLRVRVA